MTWATSLTEALSDQPGMVDNLFNILGPTMVALAPKVIPLIIAIVVLTWPLPGRGPGMFASRDVWRSYRFAPRKELFERAGGRCEAAAFIAFGRCRSPATDGDHIYPWSRGGPTTLANGQALCAGHNRSKSNMRPPWWYTLLLERRRRKYFAEGANVRVHAKLSAEDKIARTEWLAKKQARAAAKKA